MKKISAFTVLAVTLLAASGVATYLYAPKAEPEPEQRSADGASTIVDARKPVAIGDEKSAQRVEMIVQSRGRIADSYLQLSEAAAAGNAHAAFQLYQDTLRCAHIAATREILEAHAASSDPQTTNQIVAKIAEDEIACAGMTDEQLAKKADWVIRAARLGHIEAQLLFFGAATEKFDTPEKVVANAEEFAKIKIEALQHLQSAALRRNSTALGNLARAHRDGTLAKQDVVAAYGYMLALKEAGTSKSAEQTLNLWALGMTAQQLSEAEIFSRRFSTNERKQ